MNINLIQTEFKHFLLGETDPVIAHKEYYKRVKIHLKNVDSIYYDVEQRPDINYCKVQLQLALAPVLLSTKPYCSHILFDHKHSRLSPYQKYKMNEYQILYEDSINNLFLLKRL